MTIDWKALREIDPGNEEDRQIFQVMLDGLEAMDRALTTMAVLAGLEPTCIHCGQRVTVGKRSTWHTSTGTLSCDAVDDGDGWCEPDGWIDGRCAEVGA